MTSLCRWRIGRILGGLAFIFMAAQAFGQEPPKLSHVILTADGNGYFEHVVAETEPGTPKRFLLALNVDDVEAVLKSVKVTNGSVNVSSVGLKAGDLNLPFNAKANQTLLDLFVKARGTKLKLRTKVAPAETLIVVLVGVESKDVKDGKVTVLTVAKEDGKVLALPIDQIRDFEFLPPNQYLTESIPRQQEADTKAILFEVQAKKDCKIAYRLTGLPGWTAVHQVKQDKTVASRVFIENTTFYNWEDVAVTLTMGRLNNADETKIKAEDLFVELPGFTLERQRRSFVDLPPEKTVKLDVKISDWVYRPAAIPDPKDVFNFDFPLANLFHVELACLPVVARRFMSIGRRD